MSRPLKFIKAIKQSLLNASINNTGLTNLCTKVHRTSSTLSKQLQDPQRGVKPLSNPANKAYQWYSSHQPHLPFSTSTEKPNGEPQKKLTLFQRFKESYAIYGKVIIVVHGLTSCFWLATVYGIASSGLNMLEIFETYHFPEWMCHPLRIGGGLLNTWASALILYKLVAPLRYALTLLVTRYAVVYLRIQGKAPVVPERDRLRNLARESAQISRERFQNRLSKRRKYDSNMSKKIKHTILTKYRRK